MGEPAHEHSDHGHDHPPEAHRHDPEEHSEAEGHGHADEGRHHHDEAEDHDRYVTVQSSGYLLPFEIVSVHLVVVLVGAAYLARARRSASQGA